MEIIKSIKLKKTFGSSSKSQKHGNQVRMLAYVQTQYITVNCEGSVLWDFNEKTAIN